MAKTDVSIVSAQVPKETRTELEELVARGYRSLSSELRRAIDEHLKHERPAAEVVRLMAVVTVDFQAMYGGELVAFLAGEWVIDDHEIARRYPQNFKSAPRTPRSGGRSGVRAPVDPGAARSAGRRSNKVVFTEYGWEDLNGEVLEWCDGREGGGGLYGHVGHDGTIVVVQAKGCGLYAERDSSSISLSVERLRAFERPGVDLIGDWHSHDEWSPRPSPTDERGWKGSVRAASAPMSA